MRNAILTTLLAIVLGVAAWQAYRVFQLRIAHGDVYAPYSTYRADPAGCRALYEALGRMPGLEVARNEHSLVRLDRGAGTTLLMLGEYPDVYPEKQFERMEQFVKSGGRLVIALPPQLGDEGFAERMRTLEEKEKEEKKDNGKDKDAKKKGKKDEDRFFVKTQDRWHYKRKFYHLQKGQNDKPKLAEAVRQGEIPNAPPKVVWASGTHFAELGAEWRVIYERAGMPVVIERTEGSGSVVLASDTYALSNEALREQRRPEFAAWLIGTPRRVLFDETHLGISREPNTMMLIRRYRLGGVLGAVAVIALLFFWRSATTLVPRRDAEAETAAIIGREGDAGMAHLLRRGIPAPALPRVCLALWEESRGARPRLKPEVEETLRGLAAAPARGRLKNETVLARYAAMARLLHPHKGG